MVRAWVARIKAGDPACAPRPTAPVWRRPSARQAARMLVSEAELPDMDAAFVAALREGEIGTGAELARRFAAMVRERDADALPRWLEDARGGPLAGFAEGLRAARSRASTKGSGATAPRWKRRWHCLGARVRSRARSPGRSW